MEKTETVKIKVAADTSIAEPAKTADQEFDKKFRPSGALAFFVLFLILGLIIWYGIYLIMLQRI